jgi:two-component sensor histidine kinase
MADEPEKVLPQLVDQAMKLNGGSSAGLSLFEPGPDPVFRWSHLQGVLAKFEDATTPRNHSPCGVTLDRESATLASHPEVYYEWIADAGIVVPEVLLVPLYIGSEDPLGTLWIVAEDEGHFHKGHVETATALAQFAGQALKMIRDKERLRAALDEQEMIAAEMNHRLKNLFAVTDGMIRGTVRDAESVEDFASALTGRLGALASAHSLVQTKAGELGEPRLADLAQLLGAVLKAHESAGAPRISISGPPVRCGPHSANLLALIFHELATNSAKSGVLSVCEGKLLVDWVEAGDQMIVSWVETGGPRIPGPPERRGFGAKLINRTVESHFAGTIVEDWRETGLIITLQLKRAELER